MTPHRRTGGGSASAEGEAGGSRAHIVCLATDVASGSVLQQVVSAVVPDALVTVADTSSLRGAPDGDCAVIAVGERHAEVRTVLADLRGRGFSGGIVVVAESPHALEVQEESALVRFGVDAVIGGGELAEQLPAALLAFVTGADRLSRSPHGASLLASLRRTRALLAAGEMASTLRHRLNNPLAALLAEAQLLELEALAPEHASSVARIVELCRRVIEVTRSIEDVAGGGGR